MAAAVAAAAVPVATAADAGRDPVPVALAPVTVPDVVKFRPTLLALSTLPEAETLDNTEPRRTATVVVVAVLAFFVP